MLKSLMRRWRNEGGQALAEAAIVLPIFLLVVAGIIDFGRVWNQQQALTDAAREGARLSVVADPTITQAVVRQRIESALQRAAIDPTTATITTTGTFRATGEPYTVTISAPFSFTFVAPLVAFFRADGERNIVLRTASTMRNE